MNKIYKLVWSKVRSAWVVTSEIAKGHGKDSSSGRNRKLLRSGVVMALLGGFMTAGISPVAAELTQDQQAVYDAVMANLVKKMNIRLNDNNIVAGRDIEVYGGHNAVFGTDYMNGDNKLTKVAGNNNTVIGVGNLVGYTAILDETDNKTWIYKKRNFREDQNVAVGMNNTVNGGGIAIGTSSEVKSLGTSVGHGNEIISQADYGLALGNYLKVDGDRAIAVGSESKATASRATAIGQEAMAKANYTTAIGQEVIAEEAGSVAIGMETKAITINGVALGSYSVADRAKGAIGYLAGDKTSKAWKSNVGALSIGGGEYDVTRQITGVSAGSEDTDAVNVAQLKALNTKVNNGAIHYFSVKSDDSANPDGTNWKNDGATGEDAIAIGKKAVSEGDGSIAIGRGSKVFNVNQNLGMAIGDEAESSFGSIVIGKGAKDYDTDPKNGAFGVYIGREAKSFGGSSQTVIGNYGQAKGEDSTAIGTRAQALGGESLAVGSSAKSLGQGAASFGTDSIAEFDDSTALGSYANGRGNRSVASGNKSVAAGHNSVAIGYQTFAYNGFIGEDEYKALSPEEQKKYFEASGMNAYFLKDAADGNDAKKIGDTYLNTAVGSYSRAYKQGTTLGGMTSAQEEGTAIGTYAKAYKKGAASLGYKAQSNAENGVALGAYSFADREKGEIGYALGADNSTLEKVLEITGQKAKYDELTGKIDPLKDEHNGLLKAYQDAPAKSAEETTAKQKLDEWKAAHPDFLPAVKEKQQMIAAWQSGNGAVSVGTADASRQITNVAAGTQDTDAVNVAQLKALNTKVDQGAIHYYSVTSDKKAAGSNYDNDGAKADDSMVIGIGSTSEVINSTVIGNNNTLKNTLKVGQIDRDGVMRNNSIVAGENIEVDGTRNAVFATDYKEGEHKLTKVAGKHNTVIGVGNLVGYTAKADPNNRNEFIYEKIDVASSHANVVVGMTNTVKGSSVVVGMNSEIKDGAQLGTSVGHANTIQGSEEYGLALGNKLLVEGYGAIAVGTESKATANDATAIGTEAVAEQAGSIAFGHEAEAKNEYSIAFGLFAKAKARSGVAIGSSSLADRERGSIGYLAGENTSEVWKATKGAISVGNKEKKHTRQITGVAAGTEDTDAVNVAQLKALNTKVDQGAIHYVSVTPIDKAQTADSNYFNDGAKGDGGIAIGQNAASQGRGIAIGYKSNATPKEGATLNLNSFEGIAIGQEAHMEVPGGIALGLRSKVEGTLNTQDGNVNEQGTVALGTDAYAKGNGAAAFGWLAKGIGEGAMAFGQETKAGMAGAAFGGHANAAAGAVAMGWQANAHNSWATSIGTSSDAKGESSTALGGATTAIEEGSVALGAKAVANTKAGAVGYIATGGSATFEEALATLDKKEDYDKWTATVNASKAEYDNLTKAFNDAPKGKKDEAKQALDEWKKEHADFVEALTEKEKLEATWKATEAAVSVGADADNKAGNRVIKSRQITNVAAGTADTDAVNVAQLKALATAPMNFYFGGKKNDKGVYTPGTTNWSMSLNEFRMDFGDGLKAEQVTDQDGKKYTLVTLNKDSLKNDPAFKGDTGEKGADGKSAYEVWKGLDGNDGKSEQEFINSLKGKDGQDGAKGADGKSAYDIWKEKPGNDGKSEDDFMKSLKGDKGDKGEDGADGTNGADGKSAYDTWKEQPGNEDKTEKDFLDGLKGDKGDKGEDGADGTNGADGKSAYEVWKDHTEDDGTQPNKDKSEKDFLDSLKGKDGADGAGGTDFTVTADGPKADSEFKVDADHAQLNIVGDKTNITTSIEADNTVKVALNKDIKVDSVEVGSKDGKPGVKIDGDGINMNGKKIENLAPGTAANDAATVGQLHEVRDESREGDAMNAALAALKPLDFDPYNRSQVMAGVSTYKGKQAVAVGLAHYSNEDTLVHAGIAYGGSSDLMANAGISWRFGDKDDRDAKAERDARLPQYADGPISSVYVMQDEMAALRAENQELKQQVEMLMKHAGLKA